ncbi:LysM peptidoglycan-binding domain-containing protein [Kocuria palustris]|uniref:LysM peptidoglycan-binding domain-containing protein n=1 Tax=Kocuria palustris TaxID=71999 RepID=UPI0021A2BBEC|nr:LysM peptidoglycan-binding domain-containing protein [Kocuria palustris]MCT1591817.1 LysM peptidoglycan-binding domain-containing protein [Kocuria palustris]
MKKNIKNTIVAGTAAVFGGAALLGAAAPAQAADKWDQLVECEASGDWSANTGNGFSGGLQFTPQTWAAFGGSGNAADASPSQQKAVAERVLAEQGWGAWPSCSQKLGLSGASGYSGAAASTPAPAAETQVSTQSVETPAPAPAAEEAPVEQAPAAEAPAVQAPAAEAPAAEQAPVVEYTAPAAPVAEQPAVAGAYTVASGDTLGSIAAAHGTDWETLFAANPDTVADPNLIFVGQTLNIPA